MPSKFSSGKYAIAECDRCGFRYKRKELKELIIKTKNVNILVCPECWEPDQPQLSLGLYPVNDPQAIRNPRPDSNSYYTSGLDGLQAEAGTGPSPLQTGVPLQGSRQIQWGWAPVGGASQFDTVLTPNDLIALCQTGTVTVVTS
mgnify:CR=1 FL=1